MHGLLAILLPLLLVLGCADPEERAERAKTRAQTALARGEREAALEALEELRSAGPRSPEALLELTQLMVRAGEAPQAAWLIEEALPRFPGRDDLRVRMGQLAMMVQYPRRAEEAVAPIGRDSEQDLEALLVRAQAALELGELDRALGYFETAAERHPDRPEATLARVQALVQEKRHDEAQELIAQATAEQDLEPGVARRLELMTASLDANAGRHEEAAEQLERLVEEDPTDPQAWSALIQLLARTDRAEEGVLRLEGAVAEYPDEPLLRTMLADAYLRSGRVEDAEDALREQIELSDTPSAHFALARLYIAQQEPGKAAEVLGEASSRHPDTTMLKMHWAESLIEAGELDAARVALESYREDEPRDPHVDYLEARLMLAEGDAAGAAARLQRLVSRLDAPYTQFWLGRALEAQGDLEGAARRYGLAMQRSPTDPAPVVALAHVSRRRGDWRSVAAAAQRMIRAMPGMPEGYEALVEAYLELDEAKGAEALARRLNEAAPERLSSAVLLARALRAQGRFDESAAVLAAAAEHHAESTELAMEVALGLGMQGDLAAGVAALRDLAEKHPDDPAIHHALGMLILAQGDAAEGAAEIDRALELAPGFAEPLATRARFYASRGMWLEARADAERYLVLRPEDAGMHFVLGAVLSGAGETDAAIAAYRRAAELDQEHASARNNLAVLLAEQGDLDGALQSAQEAYRLEEESAHIIDTVGWLYYQKGLLERAISFLERGHRLDPNGTELGLHLGVAYAEAGRADEARAVLEPLRDRDDLAPSQRAELDAALGKLED
jgi:Flp pilus assembly protein TadD